MRKELWRNGLDYRHGTGHGIGMFLGVHEGELQGNSSILKAKKTLTVCVRCRTTEDIHWLSEAMGGTNRCWNVSVRW